MQRPWQNILSIDPSGKTVPFYAGAGQATGIGFVNLKTAPTALSDIPEARACAQLAATLALINRADTAVFSVGCHYAEVTEQDAHRITGYVEFAINNHRAVQRADSYFSLFFDFYNRLLIEKFPYPVHFDWVIMPAVFTEAAIQGFTCSVRINTAACPDTTSCQKLWASAVALLGDFLAAVARADGEQMYK